MVNVTKLVVIANQRALGSGNLLLFWGFPHQRANWLGMTQILNLMTLTVWYAFFNGQLTMKK